MTLDPLHGLSATAEESTESDVVSKTHVWLENGSFETPREEPALFNGRIRDMPVNRSYDTPREDPAFAQTRRNISRGRE